MICFISVSTIIYPNEKENERERTQHLSERSLCSLMQQSDASLGHQSVSGCSTVGDLMEAAQQCVADCYSNMLSILAVPVLVKPQQARDITLRYH